MAIDEQITTEEITNKKLSLKERWNKFWYDHGFSESRNKEVADIIVSDAKVVSKYDPWEVDANESFKQSNVYDMPSSTYKVTFETVNREPNNLQISGFGSYLYNHFKEGDKANIKFKEIQQVTKNFVPPNYDKKVIVGYGSKDLELISADRL